MSLVSAARIALRLACLVVLTAVLGVAARGVRATEPALPINAGAFFVADAADESELGFSVTDDRGVHLWSGWLDLGGERMLGAPVSRRFVLAGWVRQVFERGVLRWDSARGASVVNVLDLLSAHGHDDQLLSDFGIPASADWSADTGDGWSGIRARHLALLDGSETVAGGVAAGLSHGGRNRCPTTTWRSRCMGCRWQWSRRTRATRYGRNGAAWIYTPDVG